MVDNRRIKSISPEFHPGLIHGLDEQAVDPVRPDLSIQVPDQGTVIYSLLKEIIQCLVLAFTRKKG
jgi:hypothetical protein